MRFRRSGAMATVGTTRVPRKRWIATPNGVPLILPRRPPRQSDVGVRPAFPVCLYDKYGVAVRLTVRMMVGGLGLAWAAAAQSLLPPGVLLLARVKAHTREELARLPNCSCLETVRRDHQPAGGKM